MRSRHYTPAMTQVRLSHHEGADADPSALEPAREASDRREDIIREAARLFRAKGFKGTTTRDIAAAAGMQSGSPFYYFATKEDLLAAVMQTGMAIAAANQDRVLAQTDEDAPPARQLRALVSAHLNVLFGAGHDFMPVLMYEWPWLTDRQRQAVVAQKDSYEAAWMPALRGLHAQGRLRVKPDVARFFIFGALNWTVHWFRSDGALSLDELTAEAMKLFVDAA